MMERLISEAHMLSGKTVDPIAELHKMIHRYQTSLPRSMGRFLIRSAKARLAETLRFNKMIGNSL